MCRRLRGISHCGATLQTDLICYYACPGVLVWCSCARHFHASTLKQYDLRGRKISKTCPSAFDPCKDQHKDRICSLWWAVEMMTLTRTWPGGAQVLTCSVTHVRVAAVAETQNQTQTSFLSKPNGPKRTRMQSPDCFFHIADRLFARTSGFSMWFQHGPFASYQCDRARLRTFVVHCLACEKRKKTRPM